MIKRLIGTLFGVTLLAGAWAIQEDRPDGATFHLEQTSEQVAAQQAYQGRIDASGIVPIREEEKRSIPLSQDQSANAALSIADRRQQGAENLKLADERVKNPSRKKPSPWWFAFILVGMGLVGYVTLKDWANKNIPAMPSMKKTKKRGQSPK